MINKIEWVNTEMILKL